MNNKNTQNTITTSILHLSDLHFTRNPSMQNMRDSVLAEVKEHVHSKPLGKKLLVITGDFHNFWTADFSDSIEFINELIEAMGIEREEDVFLVPGNHDVANDDLMELLFKDTVPEWKKQKEKAIEEISKGHYDYIDSRMNSYVSYCQFVRELGVYPQVSNPIADTTPARVHIRRWRGKLNVLHLNTTLVYTPEKKEGQILDFIQANDSSMWKQYFSDKIPTIALGHNSFYDLKKEERATLQGRFGLKNVSAYLCGDTHKKEEDPDKISFTVIVNGFIETIPNIVCAKGVADLSDTYSDFGFYWHEWDEESDRVTVLFRRWRDNYLGSTAQEGPDRNYSMKRNKTSQLNMSLPAGKWKYRVLIMDDNLEQLNFLYQELNETFANMPYHVDILKATTPREVLYMNRDTDFDVFILDVARNPELTTQVSQYQDFGRDMLKRMLEERPNVKVKAKIIIYSRLKHDTIRNEFGGLDNDLDIEYIQKREASVIDIANAIKNHFDYLYHRGTSNI